MEENHIEYAAIHSQICCNLTTSEIEGRNGFYIEIPYSLRISLLSRKRKKGCA